MSGENLELGEPGFQARDRLHVSACLAQGGFARVVQIAPERVVWLGPDDRPWRFRPIPVTEAWVTELPELEPITKDALHVGDDLYSAVRVLAMQALVDGGRERWRRRELAHVIGRTDAGLSFIIDPLIKGGFIRTWTQREGRVTTLYMTATETGRALFCAMCVAAVSGRPDGRVADYLRKALLHVTSGVTAGDIAEACGVSGSMGRTYVSRLLARDLIERQPGSARGFRRTAKGDRAVLSGAQA